MKAIVKMYTYETGLYRALNNASCYHDKSKIKTLGPYALLLYKIIDRTGSFKEKNDQLINKENQFKDSNGYTWSMLYRGVSLPLKALDFYFEKLKDNEKFCFNGFTSAT